MTAAPSSASSPESGAIAYRGDHPGHGQKDRCEEGVEHDRDCARDAATCGEHAIGSAPREPPPRRAGDERQLEQGEGGEQHAQEQQRGGGDGHPRKVSGDMPTDALRTEGHVSGVGPSCRQITA